MMKSQFHAPWKISQGYLVDARGITIAKLMLNEIAPATHQINSALSAVPDLLHELGSLDTALQEGATIVIEPGTVKAAAIRAAIAKADRSP